MSTTSKLVKNVVKAGLVADAATMPVHWIYDLNKLKGILGEEGIKKPEFRNPPATPFYSLKDYPGHYETGQFSPYGEQAMAVLQYLKTTKGKFEDGEKFAKYLHTFFKSYTGYLDHATKDFIKNSDDLVAKEQPLYPQCGADDNQAQHTFKIPQLFLMSGFLESSEDSILSTVEQAIRGHQNKQVTVDYGKAFALLLKYSIEDSSSTAPKGFAEQIEKLLSADESVITKDVKEASAKAWESRVKPNLDATGWDAELQQFGKEFSHQLFAKFGGNEQFKDFTGLTCVITGAFPVAVKIVGDTIEHFGDDRAKFLSGAFAFGVRRNMLFGGDNCGRSFLVGTLLAALGCETPKSWVQQMRANEEASKLIEDISNAA